MTKRGDMSLRGSARIIVILIVVGTTLAAVEQGRLSKTAVYVAAARAVGSQDPDPRSRNPDYLAIKFLGPRERAVLPELQLDALDRAFEDGIKALGPFIVQIMTYRTKRFDAALLDALQDGATQVVVLGAGFDSRAYRFHSQLRDVSVMEVDQGPTQAYKQRRLGEILEAIPSNVSFVPMDFTKDSLLEKLSDAGYSEQENTVFLWEGVTYYLPESAVKDTLHFVRDHSAAGSRIVFDYFGASNPALNNPLHQYARWGEPLLFGFPNDRAREYVQQEGLGVLSDTQGLEYICIAEVPNKR
ncbi:MAG: class I SAM-dependent methyltransferase [Vicinamibacterales bacterium]